MRPLPFHPQSGSVAMKIRPLLCMSMILSCLSSCGSPTSDETEPHDFPSIDSFSPRRAMIGDTVTISGRSFGSQGADVLVNFGSGVTTPFAVTDTKISVVVPASATNGNLYLTFRDQSNAFADTLFVLLRVPVVELSPDSARAGELIRVAVVYFDETMDLNAVRIRFAGNSQWLVPSDIRRRSDYPFIAHANVRVPAGAATGKVGVVVGRWAPFESDRSFKAIPPLPPIRPGVWTERSSLGGTRTQEPRGGAASFTIGNKVYVVGGTGVGPFGGFGTNALFEYDPQYDAWTRKADLPGGNHTYTVAFAIGEKGYVGTGLDGEGRPLKDFWEYDPRSDTWTRKADVPGPARAYAVGFAIGNTGYLGTGTGPDSSLQDFYEYNPSADTWSVGVSFPGVRYDAYSFVVNGKAYVGGGSVSGGRVSSLYMYDPAMRSWTAKNGIPNYDFTSGNASFSIRGKGYVGLGFDPARRSPSLYSTERVYEYDPALDSWRRLPDFGGGYRTAAVGFSVGDVGYFGTGLSIAATQAYQDFWAYTP